MKLSGSTFSFMWTLPALTAMRQLQELGLNDFDILTVPGHLWPPDLSSGERRALKQDMDRDGIRIESLNLPSIDLNLASCVPDVRDYAVRTYRESLDLACDLGARHIVLVPGRISGLLPPALEDTLDALAAGIEKLLRHAERNDQTIFVESHPLTPVPTIDRLMTFFDRFNDHPRLKIAYDVASAEFIGEDQVAAIERMGARLGQTHISDSPRTAWRHDRAGTGTVDFRGIEEALDKTNFRGINILEIVSLNPLEDIKHSISALQR